MAIVSMAFLSALVRFLGVPCGKRDLHGTCGIIRHVEKFRSSPRMLKYRREPWGTFTGGLRTPTDPQRLPYFSNLINFVWKNPIRGKPPPLYKRALRLTKSQCFSNSILCDRNEIMWSVTSNKYPRITKGLHSLTQSAFHS